MTRVYICIPWLSIDPTLDKGYSRWPTDDLKAVSNFSATLEEEVEALWNHYNRKDPLRQTTIIDSEYITLTPKKVLLLNRAIKELDLEVINQPIALSLTGRIWNSMSLMDSTSMDST